MPCRTNSQPKFHHEPIEHAAVSGEMSVAEYEKAKIGAGALAAAVEGAPQSDFCHGSIAERTLLSAATVIRAWNKSTSTTWKSSPTPSMFTRCENRFRARSAPPISP